MAVGLTVDELRVKLEEILGKFHRTPRVVIHPVAYTSKKYYILGQVNGKGVFPLDRPISIIEAIAKARGFVASYPQRKEWIQADFSRSFLLRRGADGAFERVPVDFEGLFLRGELWQNFSMQPEDYLFFPPLDLQEVYVLGEVRSPGAVPYSPDLTAFAAIVTRGGFTERAFKSRVLVVRGSLNHPRSFVLNAGDILKGKGLDFPLINRDIVYVHRKPWAKAQELAEQAVISFVNAFVVAYAGQHIGPFIKEPLVK
jgi:polysaccharide export outer membrane protein